MVIGIDDTGAGIEFGLDGGAQQARAVEPLETGLFGLDLARYERQPE